MQVLGVARPFLAAVVAVVLVAASDATIAPEVRGLLGRYFKFTSSDVADLERGRVVKRSLDASAPGEIAVVGAARISASADAFVARVRNIEEFKRGPDVIQIGRFSNPPRLDDLNRLTIDQDDLDLRKCRVGACDIRLPAEAIGRFQREIDWRAPDADSRAAAVFRQVLFEHVRAYIGGGRGRITEYDDEKRVVRPGDDFDGLLKNSPYVGALVPGMPAHLREPARNPLSGTDELLYWSKERFGLTPFITVTHVVIAKAASGAHVIVSRDVYSSRYFDASLSYALASPAVDASTGFYLLYANRSRASGLKGAFAGLRRAIVERRAKNALDETLKNIRGKLEAKSR